ncbi:MAG: pilin [Candidatus Berkelbacteria bacterium]|nr:pilin [Candidatus Berkelbacteria bacterium]
MKKFISVIFFLLLLMPIVAWAQSPSNTAMFSVPNPLFPAFNSIQAVIKALIDVAFSAAGLVAVIYLIVGGFRYITSSGNAEAIEGAKATIVNSIVGLIVVFISFLLVNYILVALNVGPLYRLGTPSPSASTGGPPAGGGGGGELPVATATPTPSTPTPSTPTPAPSPQGSPPIYI